MTQAATALRNHPPNQWLTGPNLMLGTRGRAVVQELLRLMTAENALVTVSANELSSRADRVEPLYGTRYGLQPIADETRGWVEAPLTNLMQAPLANRFLPLQLGVKQRLTAGSGLTSPMAGGQAAPSPTLLLDEVGLRLHWSGYNFRRPKAYAYFVLRSPTFYSSAAAAVQADLFASLLTDALQDVAFEAGQAGLAFGVGASYKGLVLQFGGFDERLPQLLELVATSLRTFAIQPAAFKGAPGRLSRSLRSLDKRQPVALCSYHRNLALQTPRYSHAELLAEAERVSIEEVQAFQSSLLREVEVESFIGGNVGKADAVSWVKSLLVPLQPSAPLPVAKRPVRRVRRVPTAAGATQQFIGGNADNSNSAVEVYFQIGGVSRVHTQGVCRCRQAGRSQCTKSFAVS